MEEPICVVNERVENLADFDIVKDMSRIGSNFSLPCAPSSSNQDIIKPSGLDSSDDEVPVRRCKRKARKVTDSSSDSENAEITLSNGSGVRNNSQPCEMQHKDYQKSCDEILHADLSDSEQDSTTFETNKKSRIQLNSDNSDSNEEECINPSKNEGQQMRMKSKQSKFKDKFKHLLSVRKKQTDPEDINMKSDDDRQDSSQSDSEKSSIKTIKQKIKKSMLMFPSVCDPDTSDEESNLSSKIISKQMRKKERKTKPTSPKPIRMSAKQAMENMQKIKSESNRMLREKEVSLPYHRPKALSLKDIMNRRKPAVTADGKALPIKMNEEQLKHYVSMLEQRQKEMMELCKSESEDDNDDEKELESKPNKLPTDTLNDYVHNETMNNTILEAQVIDNVNTGTNELLDSGPLKDNLMTRAEQAVIIAQENILNNYSENLLGQECEDSEMKLVYNDSVEEEKHILNTDKQKNDNIEADTREHTINDPLIPQESVSDHFGNQSKISSEPESQLISLQYDSERTEDNTEKTNKAEHTHIENSLNDEQYNLEDVDDTEVNDHFMSDEEFNVDDIDKLIESAEIIQGNENSTSLTKPATLKMKPILTGGPGMVIDLDSANATKKLTGVELLKEKFTFFAKLKTPEEQEREREKMIKPGALHLKLKRELEEQIAEQRSLEWSRRLEEMRQTENNIAEGYTSDNEDNIEKIEAKLDEENAEKEISSESEEELIENDVELIDKPRKNNPMLDDEAEESDCDESDAQNNAEEVGGHDEDDNDADQDEEEESEESSDEESTKSEDEAKPKRGRILKAFEDSDDEDIGITEIVEDNTDTGVVVADKNSVNSNKQDVEQNTNQISGTQLSETNNIDVFVSQAASQDEEIQLAQRHQSASDDLFSSQDNVSTKTTSETKTNEIELGTQTFSILETGPCDMESKPPEVEDMFYGTQPYHDPKVAALASGLTQSVLNSQLSGTQSSQPIGEEILALCTGKFYDNEFVSQNDDDHPRDPITQETFGKEDFEDNCGEPVASNNKNDEYNSLHSKEFYSLNVENDHKSTENHKNVGIANLTETKKSEDGNILKSILDELNDPEFDVPKSRKFFTGSNNKNDDGHIVDNAGQAKKKFTIDSDEENNEQEQPKKRKIKKKKLGQRALHISDDEEEENVEDDEQYLSDADDDNERVVDYDSEENEIEVQPQILKKKRKATDYFEQEAELTSEDEWVGSGDEDEAGLDRMEREEGDDDVFHQGQLRKQLGQIHMREVLDQDKREVRLLQELLFEDGDLGDGHRQRKFRWKNAGGDDDTGTMVDEFGDTQEDEFESEEQWRKQRHEREVFLKQMQKENEDGDPNVSLNRTTIIKANLSSKTMSTLLMEVNQSTSEVETPVPDKKTAKDVPSPKKSFAIFQQSYHGSLLTRGGGSLARLAALATPLATDDDGLKVGSLAPSSKRNFVFSTLTPDSQKAKVTIKRKADTSLGTPKLVKKMKSEENQKFPKNSLLDQLTVL